MEYKLVINAFEGVVALSCSKIPQAGEAKLVLSKC